jgi:hypothetical protein
VNVQQAHRFVSAGGGFDVEHAGPVIRIWCGVCDKHDHLPHDDEATVERWKAAHRCGERISQWDRGDVRVRS